MQHGVILQLVSIPACGVVAQYIAHRTKLPSILFLLFIGILFGPVTHVLDPDQLFGEILAPVVSLAVAVLLFEGGMTLKLSEFSRVGRPVLQLITIGMLITWVIVGYLAKLLLVIPSSLAFLLAAIVVVSGPTVISPMLTHIRPKGTLGTILKWEGILIDPIGVLLAVLVFTALHGADGSGGWVYLTVKAATTVVVGSLIGLFSGFLLVRIIKDFVVPDGMQAPLSLVLVMVSAAVSSHLQTESGLLAATAMGMVVANSRSINSSHVVAFKEALRELLIPGLFIVLAARLRTEDLLKIDLSSALFVVILIFFVRPLAALVSTMGTSLALRERLFLGAVAPRGIVAASLASLFTLELEAQGNALAGYLVSYTFLVIIGTVTFYSLFSGVIARRLGVISPPPTGILVLGAHRFARLLATALGRGKGEVTMIDTNIGHVVAARKEGLQCYHGNILSPEMAERIPLHSIGSLLCLTSNDEANSLAVLEYCHHFGSSSVYQLAPSSTTALFEDITKVQPRGRILFSQTADFNFLQLSIQTTGDIIELTPEEVSPEPETLIARGYLPLFVTKEDGTIQVITASSNIPASLPLTALKFTPPPSAEEPAAPPSSAERKN